MQYIFIVLILLSTLAFILLRQKAIYYLPIVYIILDMGFTYFETLSVLTYIRPLLVILIFYYYRKVMVNKLFTPFYLFFAYTLLLVPFSNELFYTIKFYSQVFMTMMLYPIGYYLFRNTSEFNKIYPSILMLLAATAISSFLGLFFGIGRGFDYDLELANIGFLKVGGLYPASYSLFLIPLVLMSKNYNRQVQFLIVGLVIVNFISILINVRRTAILIPVLGFVVFFIFMPYKRFYFKWILIFAGLLIIISPLYLDTFKERFELRAEQGRFEKDFYKSESRYLTTLRVANESFSFKDPIKSLFGENLYANWWHDGVKTRMYHADHNILLAGSGIIGFILYIYLLIHILVKILPKKPYDDRTTLVYRAMAIATWSIMVFVSINGSLSVVTYRSMIFLFLGGFLGTIENRRKRFILEAIRNQSGSEDNNQAVN